MRLSLLVRSAAMGCTVWLGAAGALAQSGYPTNGGEFAIAGAMPGDQVRPALSLNASGGFLVWQGNDVCPFGLGIRALALDNTLHGVGPHFRVNQIGVADQENPQVTLLNGGGAAFVWQGGRQSFQHIYGRFLTASNTWAAGDLLLSSATNCFQQNPVLTTLAGGNVVVAYSSVNQVNARSMQDVYAQILSPTGQKVGSELAINQWTAFNQRTPAVAALKGGGFVVVWVSELQRSGSPDNPTSTHLYAATNSILPTVDVYGRVFDANGVPQGGEFLVNTSSNLCSQPSVAAGAEGGFTVTWAERDGLVTANGWDVYARAFQSDGTGLEVNRVNLYAQKDQHAPRISAQGTNYLVVWTSAGQDGSYDGVYGRFLQADGTPSGEEFRVNTKTFGRQYQPTVASDGAGRFLAVWAGYNPDSRSQDLFAQSYGLPGFVPAPAVVQYAAPPAEGFIDVRPVAGSGPLPPSTLAGLTTLPFPASGSVTAAGNALGALPGNYSGLFYETNGVNVTSAGAISVKVTPRAAYSAKLLLGGRNYSVSGKFDATGQDTKTVSRAGGLTKLVVKLQLAHLDNASGDQIRGSVSAEGQWQAQVVADRQVFNRTSNKALAYAGQYTLVLPPTTGGPAGSGFGTLTVDAGGTVRWAASLADGSKLSQSSTLSAQGYWPLFASLYKGKGLITSWVQMTPNEAGGRVIWIKAPGAVAPSFAGSFTNTVDAVISSYSKATAVSLFQNGAVSFNGGSLRQPLAKSLTLDVHGKSLTSPASELNLTLSPSTGLFRGTTTMVSPSGRKVAFQGVLLENGLYGAGFFVNNGVSGQVYWSLQ